MGKCTPEDQTSMVTPVTTLIGGLVMAAGGVVAVVLGTQANQTEAGSGNTTIAAGAAAISTGLVTAVGSITWLGFKCREIVVRDDSDDDTDSNSGPGSQEMQNTADNLDQMEQGFNNELPKVNALVSSSNSS